jgi:hypothetical protein
MGYIALTRAASFPTDVNNVLTRFALATGLEIAASVESQLPRPMPIVFEAHAL